MALEKIKISDIRIQDFSGQYGPCKKIAIKQALEQGERWVGVFVSNNKFNQDEWKIGDVKELDVTVNHTPKGTYYNGKLPSSQSHQSQGSDQTLEGLRQTYGLVKELSAKIDRIEEVIMNLNVGATAPVKKEDPLPFAEPVPQDSQVSVDASMENIGEPPFL